MTILNAETRLSASFRFYWQKYPGQDEAIAYYEVQLAPGYTKTIPADETVALIGIEPETPSYAVWKDVVRKRERCGVCWVPLTGDPVAYDLHLSSHRMSPPAAKKQK